MTRKGVSRGPLERPEIVTRIAFGVYLTFVRSHSPVYTSLSLNITREVFSYIGNDARYVVAPEGKLILVYDVVNETLTITRRERMINDTGASFAMVNAEEILIIGGVWKKRESSVRSVNIWTGEVKNEESMSRSRMLPGVLTFQAFVWVFGGNTNPSLDSVEKFHRTRRTWCTGPTMSTPKVCFTP